ncbi:FHA domain-containing protein [Verrucomicrobiales bacterium]|nr:FHA domain-containing protein [Verrucomicrobiales bacterium]
MAQTFNFIVKLADQEPIQYVLDAKKIGVGRHPDNQIQILIAEVSGKHVELLQTETGYTITEMGSSNGTKVNGTRISAGEAVELNHGDDLLLGEAVKVEYMREGATPAVAVVPVTQLAKKKLALPKKKLAVKTATPPAPVATGSPTVAEAAAPTVVLQNPTPPAIGAKTVSLSKKPLAPKKQGFVTPSAQLQSPASAVSTPVTEEKPKPAVKLAPRKLAAPTPKSAAEPHATPVIAEPEPAPVVEEKPEPAVKLAPRKLAPPAPKSAPKPEPKAVIAEPEPAPVVEEKPEPAVKLAPRKLAPPTPKAAVEEKPKPAVKLAPRKLASPTPKADEKSASKTDSTPTPAGEKEKPKPAVKLAPRKLASPSPKAEAKPEPEAETAESKAAELDQNSKGVTLIRKAAALADPDASPVLKKKDGSDDDPPSLAKREEVADVQLKKVDPVADDSPPKLVIPKKAD